MVGRCLRYAGGVLLAGVILLVGCVDQRPAGFDQPLDVEGPLAVNGRFLYLHRSFGELFFVTPVFRGNRLAFEVDRVAVGDRPVEPVVTPDGELVLVIDADEQMLSVVEVDSFREHRFELPSDYDALTVSPDSRFVVAHFADAAAGGSGDSVFRNQNEITIFDLHPTADVGGERLSQVDDRVLSLRSSPLGFDFAPPFTLEGTIHHLLVVRAVSALALVDLTATEEVDVQRRLFFVPENSPRELVPQRVIFTQDDPTDDLDMRMFVLTSNAQDIFEVSILPPGVEDEHSMALSLNQFPAGPLPVDMISFFDGAGDQKLLILNGSARQLVVVDVATGNSTEIDIDWTVTSALPFELTDPESGVQEAWALLYTTGSPTVLFANLDQLESRGLRAVTALALDRSVASVGMMSGPDADKAIVVHAGAQALSVLDLRGQFAIPLPGSATLRNVAFSATGDRLFTTVAEVAVLAMIDLENGHPSQVDLPSPGGRLAVLADPQVILVDHGDDEGRMTLLNGVDPSEETRLTLEGLFLQNALEQAPRGLEDE